MLNGLIFILLMLGQAPATAPAVPATPARLEALLRQLSDPHFAIREEATRALCEIDQNSLPFLVQRYRAENRYEPKRRIRYVIEYVFHRDQIIGRDGFMGVQVYPQVIPDLTDPVSNQATRGVAVRDVKPGYAAQRFGVHDRDVVIALDGEPVPEDPTTMAFVQQVSSRAPGTMLSLRILRPAESKEMYVSAGDAPLKMFNGAKAAPVPSELSAQGLWITSVEPGSPAARIGLRRNAILVSINRTPLGGYSNTQVENVLGTVQPNTLVALQVQETRAISLDVRLGSRPPEFVEPKDLAEARARFMRWWQAQGGDLPPRGLADPGPRMVWGAAPPPRLVPETTLLP